MSLFHKYTFGENCGESRRFGRLGKLSSTYQTFNKKYYSHLFIYINKVVISIFFVCLDIPSGISLLLAASYLSRNSRELRECSLLSFEILFEVGRFLYGKIANIVSYDQERG